MSEDLQVADLLQVEAPVEMPPPPLPGASLKAERESRGLSIGEVAHALKFSIRQIEALEADSYDALQGATFLRGFIRSYARYLKLDDASLLGLLNASAPLIQTEIVAPANMGEATTQPFIERNQKWLMLGMALVVVLAVGGYWLTMNDKLLPNSTGEVAPSKVEEPVAVVNETNGQPAVVAPSPVAVVAGASADAASGPSTPPPPAGAPAALAGEKQMTLDFDGRSWVEIKDANQRIVFTGEYGTGTHQVVAGKPPFQLWVGKVSAVRIFYNDQKVNLQPYARDDVARLTLD